MKYAKQSLGIALVLACSLVGFGCGGTNSPKSGTLQCGTGSKPCPSGYVCYSLDNFCYRTGELPTASDGGRGDGSFSSTDGRIDGATPLGSDGGPQTGTDGGPQTARDARIPADAPPPDAFVPIKYVPSPSGHALVPGGISSSSAKYMVVRTAGQSPGGNRVCESALYRFVGGVVGSTQK